MPIRIEAASSPGVYRAWERLAIGLAAGLACVAVPLYAWKVAHLPVTGDFGVYYRAAMRMHAGDWAHIYWVGDAPVTFRYGPPTLGIFWPLAFFLESTAVMIWYGLQVCFFGAGFFYLHRMAVTLAGEVRARALTAFAFLFSLRFILDSFTIGQVSSLQFLCYAVALSVAVEPESFRQERRLGTWLAIPTWLKIGPGLALLAVPSVGAVFGFIATSLFWSGVTLLLMNENMFHFSDIWPAWIGIVRADSQTFDSAHYGSQSVLSFLLRTADAGLFSRELATRIWMASGAIFVIGFVVNAWRRSVRTRRGQALWITLGILGSLLFLPQGFKYAQVIVAFPAILLLSGPRTRLSTAALFLGGALLSIPGLDIVGETVFFGMQKLSLPLLAIALLTAAVAREAWRETRPASVPA